MSRAIAVLDALKHVLKQQGVTYAQLAAALNLSEASIKRLFVSKQITLHRLEQICDAINYDMEELFDLVAESHRTVTELTEQQEQELVDNLKLMLVGFRLFNHYTFEDILRDYDITETEGIQLLAQLDRMGIIDLLPNNRVRMRLARTFSWLKDGPIQRFFERRVQSNFFEVSFSKYNELRLVLNGMLSEHSNQILQQRMQRLASEYESLVKEDKKIDLRKRHGTTLVLAIRPWEVEVFAQFRRRKSSKRPAL